MDAGDSPWRKLVGEDVVLDMSGPYAILGRLTGEQDDSLVLDDVDIHDLRDTSTTREKYVLDSREHGVRPNRRQAWVRKAEIVSISRLSDVVID